MRRLPYRQFNKPNITSSEAIPIRYGLDETRREHGFETANPLERLLIEQIVLTWLDYHITQWRYQCILKEGKSIPIIDCWERRLMGAQRRYLRSIETLARVRKMGAAIQINIAEKQFNKY